MAQITRPRPGTQLTQRPQRDVSAPGQGDGTLHDKPYDGRRLSYASTFVDPGPQRIIQIIEFLTAKPSLLRRIRAFERDGVPFGQPFFTKALDVMGIDLLTPADEIARIPREGPLIITANHPHGLVDGMVLAELLGRVRTDYKILTRSLLTGVAEIDPFMIPVPFGHDPDALAKNIEMRGRAMSHLADNGAIVLFPSGVVASADRWNGPAIERDWNAFTAKMIQRSKATVLPIRFPGQNSRAYQIASRISPTLRQSLLLYEIKNSLGRPQRPHVGAPIGPDETKKWASDPRGFMRWLREHTLALGT